MKGVNKRLDIQWLETHCDQVGAWSEILNIKPEALQLSFKNPFREDHSADCFIYKTDKYNKLLLVDFARPDLSGGLAKTLREQYGLDNIGVVNFLSQYLVEKVPDYSYLKRDKAFIGGTSIPYNTSGIKYWDNYGISPSFLTLRGINQLTQIRVNDMVFKSTLAFGYQFLSGNKRIYQPYSRKYKFVGNTNGDDIYFQESIKPEDTTLIIASGFKDAIVLNYYSGLPTVAFTSEKVLPNKDTFLEIIKNIEKIVIIYDNDETGYTQSEILEQWLKEIKKCQIKNLTNTLTLQDVALEVKKTTKWMMEFLGKI